MSEFVNVPREPTEAMKIAGVLAIDNVQPNDVSMWVTACWSAMLAAAPVSEEGGVVLDAQTVTLEWAKVETTALEEWRSEFGDYAARVVLGHDNVWSYRVNNSGHLGFASADEAKAQALSALRKRLSARLNDAHETVALYGAALATREEAPAEAGENWPMLADLHTIKGWLHGLSTAPDLTDVVADGGVSVGDCYQQEAREFAGRIGRVINALRAQPQAREEAQPDTDCVSLLADLDAGKSCGPEAAATIRTLIRERDQATPPAPEAEKLLKALRDQSWDLRCFNIPTGGDDYDIGWRVIGHWQAEPRERTIAEVFSDNPAEAVRQALSAAPGEVE